MALSQLEKDGLWKESLHGLTNVEDSAETMNGGMVKLASIRILLNKI